MQQLLAFLDKQHDISVGYSEYSAYQLQHLLNVPVAKPLLIVILQGEKVLGDEMQLTQGQFVFLSNRPAIEMRNIPNQGRYRALLIVFEPDEFSHLQLPKRSQVTPSSGEQIVTGEVSKAIELCLAQYLQWAQVAPVELVTSRRREILSLLVKVGYESVVDLCSSSSLSLRLHDWMASRLDSVGNPFEISAEQTAQAFHMSSSTMRRKLSSEGENYQTIKERVQLGYALHLLQTTDNQVGWIAEQCGYQSPSRFTERFKNQFGLTPSALRHTRIRQTGIRPTRMSEKGESLLS